MQPEQPYPEWQFDPSVVMSEGHDVVLALGARHDILDDVHIYVGENLPDVGRIIAGTVSAGPSDAAISGGTHAKMLAQQAMAHLKATRTVDERRYGVLHIFAAAPVGLLFFLGQLARGLGPCILYEHDFESGLPGAYHPSFTLPPAATTNGA